MDSSHTLSYSSLPTWFSLHQQLCASHSPAPTTITIVFLIFVLLVRATAVFPRVTPSAPLQLPRQTW